MNETISYIIMSAGGVFAALLDLPSNETTSYVPYIIMFVGGAFAALLDVHSKEGFPIINKHLALCGTFAILMGLLGDCFFLIVLALDWFNPSLSTLKASVIVLLGYRLLVRSNLVSVRVGSTNKTFGFGWLYEGALFLFIDFLKSRESYSRQSDYASLSLEDLIVMARCAAKTAEQQARVDEIGQLKNEPFKRKWLVELCTKNDGD